MSCPEGNRAAMTLVSWLGESSKCSFSLAISVWSEITLKQRWQTSAINACCFKMNFYLTFRMHTKRQVKVSFKSIRLYLIFVTAVCVLFLIKGESSLLHFQRWCGWLSFTHRYIFIFRVLLFLRTDRICHGLIHFSLLSALERHLILAPNWFEKSLKIVDLGQKRGSS